MVDRTRWAAEVRRVLVVDDQELSRRVLAQILTRGAGIESEAVDGSDGADVVAQCFTDPRPDLLILDTTLPGQEPVDVVHAIRQREAEADLAPVPIVSLGADTGDSLRLGLIDAGSDLFLTKPVDANEVISVARTLLTRTPRSLRRILVVDDQEQNVRVARRILETIVAGVEIDGMTDPRAGLARSLEEPVVDLLIVNGLMPGLDGHELIRELRAAETRTGGRPMAVIIESAGSDYLERGLKAGADLACLLPWDVVQLLASVRALFPSAPVVMPRRRVALGR